MSDALEQLLAHMIKVGASDLYLTAGLPPAFRVDGVNLAGHQWLGAGQVEALAESVMNAEQQREFKLTMEMNLAISTADGRFRINVFRQRGQTGMVVRLVRSRILSLDELHLPPVLKQVATTQRGLVLVVGAAGSGKSTTLAAMVDHRNQAATGHIVTIEDPIEFIHDHKSCVVSQREVGFDTKSYASALKNALRQAPDVILIGEIRDAETMDAALAIAETGHLCLSTLHATNANQALERILSFFPEARHRELCLQLSLSLRAVISQRLMPMVRGGRVAALEILLDTPRIRDLIKRGEVDTLKEAMEQNLSAGCRTFDSSLFEQVTGGTIARDEAMKAADSPNDLRMRIDRFEASGGRSATDHDDDTPLRLAAEPAIPSSPEHPTAPRAKS